MEKLKVYPWHDLAWDLALAEGMVPEAIFDGLDTVQDRASPLWWAEAAKVQVTAKTKVAEKLWRDIYTGKLPVRNSEGDPLDGNPELLHISGQGAPHLTCDEGNQWLKQNRYFQTWTPVEAVPKAAIPGPDYSVLASRDQLIAAFGLFTGMNDSWFSNLKDSPKLLAARKVRGHGSRGHLSEPYFCPFEVMQWLVNPKRKKGKPISSDMAWKMLETHFPKPYALYSIGDTRGD